MKKKIYILLAVIMGFVFTANVQVYALSSALDIDALKEEIKEELRSERPWQNEMDDWGIDIHGFVSQGYMCSERYNYILPNSKGGSFQFNEIGINFAKDLSDSLRIGVQLLSRDLGELYNNDVTIDWAYADYAWTDWLGIRAGILKVPNGFYNESRDIDMLRTCILLPSSVYNEGFREIYMGLSGVGVYGSIAMGGAGSMDYQLLMGTQNTDAGDSGIVKDMVNGFRHLPHSDWDFSSFDVEEMYVASLQWRSPWGLRLGAVMNSLTFEAAGTFTNNAGPPATETITIDAYDVKNYTLSAEYTWEDLILAAEYWNLEFDAKTVMGSFIPFMDATTEKEGWYVSASYRVNEWFEVGSYYSVFYPDATDHSGSDIVNADNKHEAYSKDIALSTRFDINEYWTFKMEGHRINGKGNVYSADNSNYAGSNGRFNVFVAKMTFSF